MQISTLIGLFLVLLVVSITLAAVRLVSKTRPVTRQEVPPTTGSFIRHLPKLALTLIALFCFSLFLGLIAGGQTEDQLPALLLLGAGFIVPLILWLLVTHNQLNKLRVRCERAWADIGVQLQRRHVLISRLVETVKAYAGHEHKTLLSVVEARSQAMVAQGPGEKAKAEGILTLTLAPLFGLVEAYPELRSTENFSRLQDSLNKIEESLGNTRTTYNGTVQELNTSIMAYPARFIARILGFIRFEFFTAITTEAPTMNF